MRRSLRSNPRCERDADASSKPLLASGRSHTANDGNRTQTPIARLPRKNGGLSDVIATSIAWTLSQGAV